MANTANINGKLESSDFLGYNPFGGTPARVDEYDLNTPPTVVGQPINISVTAAAGSTIDTFVQLIDANTGTVLGSNKDSAFPNVNPALTYTANPGEKYKIRVGNETVLGDYNLVVTTPAGIDITLSEKNTSFSNPISAAGVINLTNQKLEATDFSYPLLPGSFGSNITTNAPNQSSRADEYLLKGTLAGTSLNINAIGTNTFTPAVQVIDAATGNAIADFENPAGSTTQVPLPGDPTKTYLIRVRADGSIPPADEPTYSLQVTSSNPADNLTLTPRNPVVAPPPTASINFAPLTANALDAAESTGGLENVIANGFYLTSGKSGAVSIAALPPEARSLPILGLGGNDLIQGSESADNVNGNAGADTLNGGAGDDNVLRGGRGSDQIDGGDGSDILNGNNDNDTVNGGAGDDIVRGGQNNDVLNGGQGNDYLLGDRGQDYLTGEGGVDTFVIRQGEGFSAASAGGADLILDFKVGEDKIALTDNLQFTDLLVTSVNISGSGGTAVASTAIQLKADNTYLGVVQGVSSLSAGDFISASSQILALG